MAFMRHRDHPDWEIPRPDFPIFGNNFVTKRCPVCSYPAITFNKSVRQSTVECWNCRSPIEYLIKGEKVSLRVKILGRSYQERDLTKDKKKLKM